jgi:glutathione synthase/RimK-type ligase-like ATP-grasp enzyme
MRVAYVGCSDTLMANRRETISAEQHRREFCALHAVFSTHHDKIIEVDWRQFDPSLHKADLFFLRTVYDWPAHVKEFEQFLDAVNALAMVANSPSIVRWNMDKHYLNDLAAHGLPIIESLFIKKPTRLADIYNALGASEIVLKPIIGSLGLGQKRYQKDKNDLETLISARLFAQPFMPSILDSGELSMIFINGVFSHGLVKRCATGEYRVQMEYGGTRHTYTPHSPEIDLASRFVEVLPSRPMACRVDLMRNGKELLLMELEAIDPYLFPEYQPRFGDIVHAACKEFLSCVSKPNDPMMPPQSRVDIKGKHL